MASASHPHKCGPCGELGKEEEATGFCVDCNDHLCSNCKTQHSVIKATRSHEIKDVDVARSCDHAGSDDGVYFCQLCLSVGKDQRATKSCTDCEMYICDACHRQHERMKATKDHEVKSLTTKPAKQCILCLVNDIKAMAVYHCRECKFDLCPDCTAKHRQIKSTRDHSIVDDANKPIRNQEHAEPTSPVTDSDFCPPGSSFSAAHPPNSGSPAQAHKPRAEEARGKPSSKESYSNDAYQPPVRGKEVYQQPSRGRDANQPPSRGKDADQPPVRGKDRGNDGASASPEDDTNAQRPSNRPDILTVTSESVELFWDKPKRKGKVDYYEIRYKEIKATKWESFNTKDGKLCTATVTGLKCSTKYHFKVRAVYNDEEGPYTDVSKPVETSQSLAKLLVGFSVKQDRGKPAKYKIPITVTYTNQRAKTRKCVLGESKVKSKGNPAERTIMLVGATGAGKSTLLDGMMNYITNVAFNDDFRFTVVDLMEDEKTKKGNQAESQTEWITCYKIFPMDGSRVDYTLNIIDTPGFGDVRGIERDKVLVEQIREFFCTKGDGGVDVLDAVCFVTQAPLARLTPTQRYIFDSILSVFGKDIASNIVIMITFADGNTPPVLAALKAGKVPYKQHCVFNNSALFAQESEKFAPMFWDMGRESYRTFFDLLQAMETRSLSLTAEVLKERKQLEQTVNGLLPQVNRGLNKMEEIRRHKNMLNQHKMEMDANKNFKFKDTRTKDRRIDLEAGKHITNCMNCHYTCHFPCQLPNDDQKARCWAMNSNGYCNVCPQKCFWNMHYNNGYKIESYEEEYEGTYEDLLRKYNVAKGKTDKTASLLRNMKAEFAKIGTEVHSLITEINRCLNHLKTIALKPDPLNDVQYIEQLIESEKMSKRPGFQGRIKSLENIKKQAEVTTKVHMGKFDPFEGFNLDDEDTLY